MDKLHIFLNIILYFIQFIGRLVLIIFMELYDFIINIDQIIFHKKNIWNISSHIDFNLPFSYINFILGIFLIILYIIYLNYHRHFNVRKSNPIKKFLSNPYHHIQLCGNKMGYYAYKKYIKYNFYSNHHFLTRRKKLDPTGFEYFCGALFYNSNFKNVIVTPPSGDYGIDVAVTYRQRNYGIQCKLYNHYHEVGVAAVQEAISGTFAYGLDTPIVITTSHYTAAAKEMAAATGTILINQTNLQKWQKHPNYIFKVINANK